uniref:Uncharacterized protein n=1 Tax=Entomoneis paludosa TaxID=265537 RepID=A0A7S2YDE0_9STRA|mmetsp:Transcript_28397/g.59325  ORF Transcript_28397/g.59325 Transcript_28397/m.59325 type:complete len:237 (+) Transcript_28397:67-777(+)|eukprot:CAMPEP_0172459806 /NCGR_PEP_ID=MMETSP1065-20121228/34258_1 /TAXON_ID=265537 /ORGANISM="Amphiprora paludosa, Strain CCMP125" /LENGTH=236 /DNA_ID=CAMNT_0013214645 /DNA_START=24 /DNA_END=734 /DNA_ORIENTATION=+
MPQKHQYSELDQALDELDLNTNDFEDEPTTTLPDSAEELEVDPLSTAVSAEGAGLEIHSELDETSTQQNRIKPIIMAAALVAALVILIVLLLPTWLLVLLALALAGLIVAARSTIPPRESFHIQKEMQKMKREKLDTQQATSTSKSSWFGKKAASVKNALSTATKQVVGGYDEVLFCDVGVGILVAVRDLTNGKCYTWVGAFHQWRALTYHLSAETNANIHQWLWHNQRGASTIRR